MDIFKFNLKDINLEKQTSYFYKKMEELNKNLDPAWNLIDDIVQTKGIEINLNISLQYFQLFSNVYH